MRENSIPKDGKIVKSINPREGDMWYEILFAGIIILFLTQIALAQEASYELAWSNYTGESYESISISSNSSFIASGSQSGVYFFNKEGKLLGSYAIGDNTYNEFYDGWISSDGSYILTAGIIYGYAPSKYGKISLFNKEGKLLWSRNMGSYYVYDISGSVSSEGYVIAGAFDANDKNDYKVEFFNKDGNLLWSYVDEWLVGLSSVSISSDGAYMAVGSGSSYTSVTGVVDGIYYGNSYVSIYKPWGKIHFINREGKLLWSYKVNDRVEKVSVSSEGSYIAASSGSKVYFFNREGKLLWDSQTNNSVSAISVSSNGSYTAVGSGNEIYLFNRDGKLLWNNRTIGSVSAISVSSDGSYIAHGSSDKKLYFLVVLQTFSYGLMEETKRIMEVEKAKGFNLSEAGTLISEAEKAYNVGIYVKAKELARQAKDSIETISEKGLPAKEAIDKAKSAISQEKSKGFNVADAESTLEAALRSFNTNDFSSARDSAERAKSLALDIDQDGIPNSEDFAPYINNYYIYSGVAIFLVGSIITIRTSLRRKERLRLERQRLAEEQRRREEERKRLKNEEKKKQGIEKMKQKILNKIDEVMKKED